MVPRLSLPVLTFSSLVVSEKSCILERKQIKQGKGIAKNRWESVERAGQNGKDIGDHWTVGGRGKCGGWSHGILLEDVRSRRVSLGSYRLC